VPGQLVETAPRAWLDDALRRADQSSDVQPRVIRGRLPAHRRCPEVRAVPVGPQRGTMPWA
jgi:hypothetical protein